MHSLVFLSVLSVCFVGICGARRSSPQGAGAYAYQDSTGKRYGGTFDINDGDIFGPNNAVFPDVGGEQMFPDYFRNLQSLLQEAFNDINSQRLAYDAANKAFDLTWNQASFIPNFASRFGDGFTGFGGMPGFGNFPGYNAAAGGMVGPGFTHQYAHINPQNPGIKYLSPMADRHNPTFAGSRGGFNPFGWQQQSALSHNMFSSSFPAPNMPNIDFQNRFGDTGEADGKPHFYSVQSSAFSSSSNLNGKESNHRGADTVVNKDGKVTKFHVGD